jgi:hypothetical protein
LLDSDVATWVATDLSHGVEFVARRFSWLGGWIGPTLFGVAMALVLLRERAWNDLLFLAAALIGSNIALWALKR